MGQKCNGGVVKGASYPVTNITIRLETAAPENVYRKSVKVPVFFRKRLLNIKYTAKTIELPRQ